MVEPRANAMAQVRTKPVMREMMTKKLISAADPPIEDASDAGSGWVARASREESSDVEMWFALILRFRGLGIMQKLSS